ncbi:MAG: DNA polymerase IV [Porticoccaceae bacterium]|nr:DNA polymerase IV [Porticoccaceae bacterium]
MRKIIHCDCDCFYAAVEMRDDPSLVDLPIAVGGNRERRGVVATCNYRAREFGVKSAMPTGQALKLCPDLVVLPTSMAKYREAAMMIRSIFFRYTERVEPLSLDEAFLDVSDSRLYRGSATLLASEIRRVIAAEVGVTASAGIAQNKFLAKIASDLNKPDGQCVITPEKVDEFIKSLPVTRIFGVGEVTRKKLKRMGVGTCGELQEVSLTQLAKFFGSFGSRLHALCRGIDEREVNANSRRKSLSVERTFSNDLVDCEACIRRLPELLIELRARLERIDSDYWVTKQVIKVKFDNFTSTTLERQLNCEISLSSYQELLFEAWGRGARPVRLLGLGVRFIDHSEAQTGSQLRLFPR